VIRQALATDAEAISRIHNHYILNTVMTFEEQLVSPGEMAERIAEVTSASLPWLIAEQDESILGYARASKWKGRSAYRFSVETTIYLAPDCFGRGIGTSLYQHLLR
jgi:L-amino acid N-acyltransferase YncA